jgi:hypothetical protein
MKISSAKSVNVSNENINGGEKLNGEMSKKERKQSSKASKAEKA